MIGNRIRELRREKDFTLEQLASLVGTSKQTIQRYESGVIANIPREKIEALATALGTSPTTLMGWDSGMPSYENVVPLSTQSLPILGHISCGEPIYAEERHEGYVALGKKLDADFCLIAKGDSMTGARINDGDVVFIRSQNTLDNGEIGVVIINDEATLKRVYFYPEEQKLILVAENPRYAPFVYVGRELEKIKILGKAVAFQSRII
jgi:repressor LexA